MVLRRGWMGLSFALLILFIAIFMLFNRWFNKRRPIYELKVMAPPAMNTMEQLLKLQNAISQLEELVQDGNVVLLKLQALSLSVFPKASEKLALGPGGNSLGNRASYLEMVSSALWVEIGRKKKSAAKKEGVEEGEATIVEEVKKSQHVLRKLEKRKEEQKLDSHIEEQFGGGRLAS
ncbi:hypothetical protein IFM89_031819 [Coptis chinensis]|uniref:Uncharacterized protein n=1 Tax=Coptis chinensis TaxID=261450 RepID=A0A835LP43_9MAGN|nr:hypothetical protein IFM89_031819 [Coptis chinensis]